MSSHAGMSLETRTERRTEPLTKAQIVEAALGILDQEGENALTFRALATRLATGSGALYHHVSSKDDLLAAATDDLIAQVTRQAATEATPEDGLRALARGVFDVLELHPWIGSVLSRNPWQYAVVRLIESIGQNIQALGVPGPAQFNAATAVMSFILGLASQHASRARLFPCGADQTMLREAALSTIAARWMALEPSEHPFVRQVAEILPDHDDREQFLGGIDILVRGLKSL
jgi:AcrR family transcriptional regulator